MTRNEECSLKLKQIRTMLNEKGVNGVLIKKQPNFSWVTAGGRGFIGLAGDVCCGTILITDKDVYLAANNIEAPRLMAEELPEGFAGLIQCSWPEDGRLAARLQQEFGKLTDDTEQEAWFKQSRVSLLPSEVERYKRLGTDAANALENVCFSAKPGISEFEVAGRISSSLWALGIEPITLLIAADERSESVRHYVPTEKKASKGFIASICARRAGLVVSATRIVGFSSGFASGYGTLLNVEAAAFKATQPGNSLNQIYREIVSAYESNGLYGEWKNHHQGGMTGYLAREYRADDTIKTAVEESQAFAWNPSTAGAKCEDTVVTFTDGIKKYGLKVITACSNSWPSVDVRGIIRPNVFYK